jgi:hypothetical protein
VGRADLDTADLFEKFLGNHAASGGQEENKKQKAKNKNGASPS